MKTILFLLFLFPYSLYCQDLQHKIANQICKCAKKKKAKTMYDLEACYTENFMNNMSQIYKELDYNSDSTVFQEFTLVTIMIVMKNCDYINKNVKFDQDNNTVPHPFDESFKCDKLVNGEYYYLEPVTNDTTYVTILDEFYLERLKSGKTFSKLEIKWKDSCNFDLIFDKSNDLNKKSWSKKGDTYNYKVISKTPDYYDIELDFKGNKYYFTFYIIKK